MRSGHRRIGSALLAGLLGVTVLAACGGDDDDSASTATTGTNTSAKPAGSPIKIGVLIELTGAQAAGQEMAKPVTEAWEAWVNDNGGIAGHPVEVEIKDSGADAAATQAAAQGLVDDDSIVAALSNISTTEGGLSVLSEGRLPLVGGVGYNTEVWSNLPYVYAQASSTLPLINSQAITAEELDSRTVASTSCAENTTCEQVVPLYQMAVEAAGLTWAGNLRIAADAPNYTAECVQLSQNEADWLILTLGAATAIRVATDCNAQGYTGWYGLNGGAITVRDFGDSNLRLAGSLNGFPWYADDPKVEEFRQVMEDQGVDERVYGTPTATGQWTSLELFREVLEAHADEIKDGVTRDQIIDFYGQVKGETLDGLIPAPVTYKPGDAAQPMVPCWWIFTFENNEFSTPDGMETTCDPQYQ
jgi:branched-chain amino acid transport system substrate-binding protein